MKRFVVVVGLALAGCPRAQVARTATLPSARVVRGDAAALARLQSELMRDRALVAAVGVTLRAAEGALEITGDRAVDESVTRVSRVTLVGRSAALLVETSVGNAYVVGLVDEGGRWRGVGVEALMGDARPGQRWVTTVTADARAMTTAETRELVTTVETSRDDGDEARDPTLVVMRLRADGAVVRLGAVAFGSSDPESAAQVRGEWVVDEALALPRELYVQLSPGQRGVGGAGASVIVRRSYRATERALEMTDENQYAVQRRGP